jgi:hypothetical protein
MTMSNYPISESVVKRFWKYVDQKTPTACWIWTGGRYSYGYGFLQIGTFKQRKTVRAHRLSYAIANRIELEKFSHLQVLHNCDNPPCVNPSHLRLGNNKENAIDARDRNRLKVREHHGPAKLTWNTVNHIRELYGKLSARQAAHLFNTCPSNILCIWKNKTWKEQL